ncbi:hypothetical protein BU16DRAFT_559105 [Lophium mytilinum]|uniref:Uncharacterized protein n=1 Tax=Lophium mytilinum TaxID=390894 RepID=A0A6A6QZB8_9PEZI|nr:hypothetical protein BU16DRAFT_559105 [Lophium mytilinum]
MPIWNVLLPGGRDHFHAVKQDSEANIQVVEENFRQAAFERRLVETEEDGKEPPDPKEFAADKRLKEYQRIYLKGEIESLKPGRLVILMDNHVSALLEARFFMADPLYRHGVDADVRVEGPRIFVTCYDLAVDDVVTSDLKDGPLATPREEKPRSPERGYPPRPKDPEDPEVPEEPTIPSEETEAGPSNQQPASALISSISGPLVNAWTALTSIAGPNSDKNPDGTDAHMEDLLSPLEEVVIHPPPPKPRTEYADCPACSYLKPKPRCRGCYRDPQCRETDEDACSQTHDVKYHTRCALAMWTIVSTDHPDPGDVRLSIVVSPRLTNDPEFMFKKARNIRANGFLYSAITCHVAHQCAHTVFGAQKPIHIDAAEAKTRKDAYEKLRGSLKFGLSEAGGVRIEDDKGIKKGTTADDTSEEEEDMTDPDWDGYIKDQSLLGTDDEDLPRYENGELRFRKRCRECVRRNMLCWPDHPVDSDTWL